jgi:hypothetical protein
MAKIMKHTAGNFTTQVIGHSITNGTQFIIHQSNQFLPIHGVVSINDSKPVTTEKIVEKHIDKYDKVWKALS